jgi:DNA-binding transcriptional ArsR family regulator
MVVDQFTEEEIDRLFHALADATRRDIVRRAIDAQHSVSELARRYPMSLTAVQKHVDVLADAGLVEKRRHGREQHVVGRHSAIQRAQALLEEFEQLWRIRLARIDQILDEDPQGATT